MSDGIQKHLSLGLSSPVAKVLLQLLAATRTASVACLADGIPRLAIQNQHSEHIDAKWLDDAIAVLKSVEAFDLNFPKDVLKAKLEDGVLIVEFMLKGIDGKAIATSKWSGVSVDGPRSMWGPFTYEIPRQNAEAAIDIALRNCIG